MHQDTRATITMLQSNSLSDVVRQAVEQSIVSGAYASGSKLNEMEIAESLGVSRGPVREAFRSLSESGLVRTEKNRGVFVREIPIEEAGEIYELRAALEALIGRLLASRITPAQVLELDAQVDAMTAAVRQADVNGYHQLNLGFHDRLAEMSGNRKLLLVYRRLIRELSQFRRLNLDLPEVLPRSVAQHKRIVSAIARGQSEAAARALYEHVEESRQRMLRTHAERQQAPT